jgi:hypothetical protein
MVREDVINLLIVPGVALLSRRRVPRCLSARFDVPPRTLLVVASEQLNWLRLAAGVGLCFVGVEGVCRGVTVP